MSLAPLSQHQQTRVSVNMDNLPELRNNQIIAMEAALASKDVVVVLPTGAGKSLCYVAVAVRKTEVRLLIICTNAAVTRLRFRVTYV